VKKLPKRLPASLPSALGPVPVVVVPDLKDEKSEPVFGMFHRKDRRIEINADLSLASMWQTLYHEWAHLVLSDSGHHFTLTEKAEESLCDALGTARVMEMMNDG
jgi:hypothetical protein